jgi:uncharacterized protein (DUF2236 family)
MPTPDDIPLRALDALPYAARARERIAQSVLGLVAGSGAPAIDYLHPEGDPGLFGPEAVCWRVHADFTSMMVGGIGALLLQMLHPLALAGVVDHSNFRKDMLGRLRRTASFVAGTTYGSRQDAEMLVARVRKVHRSVNGVAPDGRPYTAEDPALLTWVHVAEVSSFLQGHLRYVDERLSPADQDRYYDETARVAEALGARDVPRSRAAVDAYLEAMRPALAVNESTREVARILLEAPAPKPAMQPFSRMFMLAGIDIMPSWAQRLGGYEAQARRGCGPSRRCCAGRCATGRRGWRGGAWPRGGPRTLHRPRPPHPRSHEQLVGLRAVPPLRRRAHPPLP